MLIRVSERADLSYLEAVERSAARKFVEYFDNDTSYTDRTLGDDVLLAAHENKSLWIAQEQDNLVGFLAAICVDGRLHIEEISVMFDYQGQGIGKNLIKALIVEAKNRNCLQITLTTDSLIPWNKPFYEKIGFEEIALKDCTPGLADILAKDKKYSRVPDNRIAMVLGVG